VRLDVITGELVGRRHHFEPPGAAALGSGFGAMQQITFADHSDHPILFIHNRERTDAVIGQQLCNRLNGRIFVYCNYLGRHQVHRTHPERLQGGSNRH
jgi:hypothetical protein